MACAFRRPLTIPPAPWRHQSIPALLWLVSSAQDIGSISCSRCSLGTPKLRPPFTQHFVLCIIPFLMLSVFQQSKWDCGIREMCLFEFPLRTWATPSSHDRVLCVVYCSNIVMCARPSSEVKCTAHNSGKLFWGYSMGEYRIRDKEDGLGEIWDVG